MSFVGKAISSVVGGVGKALGLVPQAPQAPLILPAPTVDNSAAQLDQAAQVAAAGVQRGRTSTMLTGGAGVTEDFKNTSKILLGQ